MKKPVPYILAAEIAAILLTGCGGAQTQGNDPHPSYSGDTVPADFSAAAGTPATAGQQDEDPFKKSDTEWDFYSSGFVFKVPECIKNAKGQIDITMQGQVEQGIYKVEFCYTPKTDEEAAEYAAYISDRNENNNTQDGNDFLEKQFDYYYAQKYLFAVAGFDKSLNAYDWLTTSDPGKMKELGESGDLNYYLILGSADTPDIREDLPDEFYKEFKSILADADTIASCISLKEIK